MAPVIGKKKSDKKKFEYQSRSVEEIVSRQKSFSGRESYFQSEVKFYVPKGDGNKMRILPPTWDDSKHYGFDIHVHYSIGPDNVGYLCLNKMTGEACPLCEARQQAEEDNDPDLAKSLRATRRVATWIIDRNDEKSGPKMWAMPQTVDKEILTQSFDKESGEILALDHPDEGFDVLFNIEGQGQTKKYVGVRLARRESPISDDEDKAVEWLTYITEHPVPSMMVIRSYDEIKAAFEGKSAKKDDEDDAKGKSAKVSRSGKDEEDDSSEDNKKGKDDDASSQKKVSARPKIGAPAPKKEETEEDGDDEKDKLPTWDAVHEMSADDLGDLADAHDLEFPKKEFESIEACADWVCKELEIEKPEDDEDDDEDEKKDNKKESGSKLSDRLRNLKKK